MEEQVDRLLFAKSEKTTIQQYNNTEEQNTMTKFKKTLTIIISALVISILNLSISAYAIESFSNPNDGLENCHQLDQYEVNDNYILHDANDHNAFSSRAVTLPQYTSGTYFTNDSMECTDHGTVNGVYIGNPCQPGVSCNCKEFEWSIQCAGFARYVYKTYHGYSINSVSKNTLNKSTSTAEVAKETLKDLPEGTFIKVKARTSSGSTVTHFMIVSRASEDDVILYHANYGGNCKVRNMRITYEVFANNFPYVYYTC